MSDLTVIFLTANQHPKHFTAYHKRLLLEAVGDYPLITVSREPLDFGENIIDDGPRSHLNMYKQLCRAARLASTPYIAMAEDDALYPPHHFKEFRPALDSVSYDMHRWSLFTWTNMYNIKDRISNCTMLSGREYYLDAWDERLKKFPGDSLPLKRVSEIGRNNQEEWMGVSLRNCTKWWATEPTIHINHPNGTDSTSYRKRMGTFRAYDIPYWGSADKIIAEYR